MQARFYAPWFGRFLSPDPARDQHFEETQSWNIYSYVQNNPVMHLDPTGEETRLVYGAPIAGDRDSYGHASIIISRNGRSVAYDFGRYGSAKPSNGLMSLFGIKNSGPGILRTWKNGDAYLKDQSKNRDQTVYTLNTSKAEESALRNHYDQLQADGQKKGDNSRFSTTQTEADYGIVTNSCVTQSANPLSGAVGTKDGEEGFSTGQGLVIKGLLAPVLTPADVKAAGEAMTAAGLAKKQEIKKQEPKKKENQK